MKTTSMIWQTTPLTSCCKATGSSKYDSKIAKEYASTFPPLCLPCSLHPDYITTTATSFPYLLRYSFSSLLLSLNFASGGGWRFLALLFFFLFCSSPFCLSLPPILVPRHFTLCSQLVLLLPLLPTPLHRRPAFGLVGATAW